MQVEDLGSLGPVPVIETDLAIVGGGAAGLTIAREFFNTPTRVLVVESGGLKEEPRISELNSVESIGEPRSEAQIRRRTAFHGENSPSWSHEVQRFGVRCRVLGGSTQAWVGKSAAFDETDFTPRGWVPFSGWPFGRETLAPYMDRAVEHLNLGPNCSDDGLWELVGLPPPRPALEAAQLRSFFWQFARSRTDRMDILRLGPEFLRADAPNVRVLLNATVTRIDTDELGTRFDSLAVSTIDGARATVRARAAVLAASGIENPRLLLASDRRHPGGLGNRHDLVGRFLMDHPSARIGRFDARDSAAITKRFGFYGLQRNGQAHMYMHGLAPSPALQERERLLNCAAYMMEERAPDDPWDALKRLLRRTSSQPLFDLRAVASSPGLLAKGLGMRLLRSDAVPEAVKDAVVNAVIRFDPNFAVREFQSRGLPHKLTGVAVDVITEQRPDPDSRITLSDRRDPLGVPLARVDWRIDRESIRSIITLGRLIAAEFPRIGLPAPALESWVAEGRPEDSVIIDMGHTVGATRMSADPKQGVVDPNCQVHGVAGLYVAGASVFPTSGHANPTLMIAALAIRLADRVKSDLART